MRGELFTEIGLTELGRFFTSRYHGFQEKYNGQRRCICKQHGTIRDFNREGGRAEGLPLPKAVIKALLAHPLPEFVVEVELVKNKVFLFDALILGAEMLVGDAYEYREARYHVEFDGFHPDIIPVKTERTEKGKRELVLRLAQTGGEGIIIRDMRKAYREGRAKQHFKFKFWKDLDAVVIGASPEGKDSVRVGVYDEHGKLHEIGGVTLKDYKLAPGDVVTVKYLYGTRDRHIKEPSLLCKRVDKRAKDCTIDQIRINKNFIGEENGR
jgi:ATP-dependent DNA ligase